MRRRDPSLIRNTNIGQSNKDFDFHRQIYELLDELGDSSGVYAFCRGSNIEYVGFSTNLSKRIKTSFTSKYNPSSRAISVRYISANKSDARILETYLICKLKPKYNGEGKYEDEPTITINAPQWSESYRMLRSL